MYGIEGLLAGRTLVDRYLVEEVIGRGGMGAVYRARDVRLDREVALKVVAMAVPDPAAHARLRARFHREARAAAALHHPNVVAVHDFGTDPAVGIDFLVMELLRGEDLATRLSRKGPPALRTALDVLYQTARGLAAGHRAGLIHRDVKPGNLFLEPGDRLGDVQVKVLDFGIAEIAAGDDQTMTQLTVAGRPPFSPAYASPEQMLGETRLRPATDVFSLGAVGFHLLTGERAFTSSDPRQAAIEVTGAIADLQARGARLPAAVRAVLRRALSLRPEERYPDAGALADALEPALAERDLPASDTGPRAASFQPPAPRTDPPPQYTSAALQTREAIRLQYLQRGIDPQALQARTPPPAPAREAERRPGWFVRAATAVWNFCVTTTVVGLFAGCWVLVVQGLEAGDPATIYAGVAVSTMLAPLAVHRILGRRGSYLLALVGSVAATLGAYHFLGPEWEGPSLLAGICGLQLASSALIERLTRRSRPHLLAQQHS